MSDKVQFSTKISKDMIEAFKEKCKKDNIKMNEVMEALFKSYIKNEIKVEKVISLKK